MLKLTIARKLHKRFPLQNAIFIRAEVFEDFTLEEKIAAIDPIVGQVRLLRKLNDFIISSFSSPNRDGGFTPRTVAIFPCLYSDTEIRQLGQRP